MTQLAQSLIEQIHQLTAAEQQEIFDFLADEQALTEAPDFDALLTRRFDEIKSGQVKTVSGAVVMETLRTKYA